MSELLDLIQEQRDKFYADSQELQGKLPESKSLAEIQQVQQQSKSRTLRLRDAAGSKLSASDAGSQWQRGSPHCAAISPACSPVEVAPLFVNASALGLAAAAGLCKLPTQL